MNYFLISFLLLTFLGNKVWAQARLTVDISQLEKPAYAILPKNGKFVVHNDVVLDPGKRRKVSLKVEAEALSFIYFFYDFNLFPVFLKPGMRTKVTLSPQGEVRIAGDYQQENTWINQLPRRFISYNSRGPSLTDVIFEGEPERAFAQWKDMLQESLKDLSAHCAPCDDDFVRMARTDLTYFYANEFVRSVLHYAPRAVVWEDQARFSGEDERDYQQFAATWGAAWDSIYSYVPIEGDALYSEAYLTFLRAYYEVYRIGFRKELPARYDDLASREKRMLQQAEKELNRSTYEALYAFNLDYIIGGGAQSYAEYLIAQFERFRTEFPDSDYLPSLEKRMQPAYAFAGRSENHDPDNRFLTTGQIESLDELIEEFRGKVVFIDIWATWCAPCLREFESNGALYDYLEGKDVVPLYISVDEPDQENRWKTFVAKYELKGNHIMASEDLVRDIWRRVGDEGVQGIPRYIIFDRSGRLIAKDAPRPSDGNRLRKQLTKALGE